MNRTISLLLLASTILLTPQLSASEPKDVWTPSLCAAALATPATPSSPELPIIGFPTEKPRCGTGVCGYSNMCSGSYAGERCGMGPEVRVCNALSLCPGQEGRWFCSCDLNET